MTKIINLLLLITLMTLSLASCTSGSKRESTGEYLDSAVITTKVKAAFVREKSLSSLDIHVNTYKNIVQLSGFVQTTKEKKLAEVIAKNVSGVTEVKNDLIVRPK